MRIVEWVKSHKLASLLLLVIFGYIFTSNFGFGLFPFRRLVSSNGLSMNAPEMDSYGAAQLNGAVSNPAMGKIGILPPQTDYAPQPDVPNRLVIENSNLSLLVKDVTAVKDQIIEYAQTNGGYMVSASISNPQDAPTGTVTVRIPSATLKATLDYFHSLSIKVVSENLQGTDVTDQYVDIDAHIADLTKTKQRFEEILSRATEISDITNVNQQIISIQQQIDSYKGQQESLQKNAQLAKITVYLSTDEIALPYAPSETFRPGIIFKLAVRSLVGTLRDIATMLIWVGVYAIVWVPLLIAAFFIYRRMGRRQQN